MVLNPASVVLHVGVNPLGVAGHVSVDTREVGLGTAHAPTDYPGQTSGLRILHLTHQGTSRVSLTRVLRKMLVDEKIHFELYFGGLRT